MPGAAKEPGGASHGQSQVAGGGNMRRAGSGDGRWLSCAEQRAAAMRSHDASSNAAAAAAVNGRSDPNFSSDAAPPWAAGPSSHFQVADGNGGSRDAAEAARSAGASAMTAFPPHAAPAGSSSDDSSAGSGLGIGRSNTASSGQGALRDAAAVEATHAKAAVSTC